MDISQVTMEVDMEFYIRCVCGERISVTADDNEAAVSKLIAAMDQHLAAKNHPDVPGNLTHEQKEGMVRSTMKKG